MSFVVDDDGTAVVVYGKQPAARFPSLVEALDLHGLDVDDVVERPA